MAALLSPLERVATDAFDAFASVDAALDRHLVRCISLEAPADAGVFAFGVLANAEHVDGLRRAIAERRWDAVQNAHGSQVDVLVEALPDREQESAKAHVVGHGWKPDGAEIDRVMIGEDLQSVGRHHHAVFQVVGAGPGQIGGSNRETTRDLASPAHHLEPSRDDLRANAISGNAGEPVAGHEAATSWPSMMTGSRGSFPSPNPGPPGDPGSGGPYAARRRLSRDVRACAARSRGEGQAKKYLACS